MAVPRKGHFIAVDPGITGGIAEISSSGRLVQTVNIPTYTILKPNYRKNAKSKTRKARYIDTPELFRILDRMILSVDKVFIEHVHSMPGQGVATMFQFGRNFGEILGCLAALQRAEIHMIRPATWMKFMTQKDDELTTKQRAKQAFHKIWPDCRVKVGDGVIDAALIAEYGRRVEVINGNEDGTAEGS